METGVHVVSVEGNHRR